MWLKWRISLKKYLLPKKVANFILGGILSLIGLMVLGGIIAVAGWQGILTLALVIAFAIFFIWIIVSSVDGK
jgi:hypothetical protein